MSSRRHTEVHHGDGFGSLRGLLPPPSRRGVVLIDPPYEIKNDYRLVQDAVREALTRFPDCVVMVWYPQLQTMESQRLPQALKNMAPKSWVHARMTVASADSRGFGMVGSGMVIINPGNPTGAVLDVMRWRWREAEDWALWIGAWPALRLFISDLGTDLVGACNTLKIPQQADVFHERQWWNGHVFQPLSRRERKLAENAMELLDQATRVQGPGRRLGADKVEAAEAERAEVERQFYVAVQTEEKLLLLFEPLVECLRSPEFRF